jgi:hypothetical protein
MQPIADANPVGPAAAVIRSLAAGGPLAAPLIELGSWLGALILIPGTRAARRWNSPAIERFARWPPWQLLIYPERVRVPRSRQTCSRAGSLEDWPHVP